MVQFPICLPEIIAEIRQNDLNRQIVVDHDNENAPTSQRTVDILSNENIELMSHYTLHT